MAPVCYFNKRWQRIRFLLYSYLYKCELLNKNIEILLCSIFYIEIIPLGSHSLIYNHYQAQSILSRSVRFLL
jgi:hypothetical protein